MDCCGLCREWEEDPQVRDRVRVTNALLEKQSGETFCVPSRVNAVANSAVLRPVLVRLADTEKNALPHLEGLQMELRALFEKCGMNPGDDLVYKSSVELKRLAGFVKRRCKRREVTKDKSFHVLLLILDPTIQEAIDLYMKSCKRSRSASSGELEVDEEFEDEDDQSKNEFDDFKKWLDSAVESPMPSDAPLTAVDEKCGKCEHSPCQCASIQQRVQELRAHIAKQFAEKRAEALASAKSLPPPLPKEEAEPPAASAKGPAQEARKSGVRDTDETQPLEDENATPEIAAFDLTMPVDNETQPYSAEQGGLPKVLTRRDQLKLKEEKVKAKKEEQEAKEAAKLEKKEAQQAKKAAKKAEQEAKKQAKAEAKAKAKAKGKKASADAEAKSGEVEVEEEQNDDPAPKRRRLKQCSADGEGGEGQAKAEASKGEEDGPKPKAKAKAKQAAQAKPKPKPKAKGKAKATPKRKSRARKQQGSKSDEEIAKENEGEMEEELEEPEDDNVRRKLFHGAADGDESPHLRIDPKSKSGNVKPLQQLFEEDVPARLNASRPRKEPADVAAEEEGGAKRRKKQALSPFAKKEQGRRKKKEKECMEATVELDPLVQGVFLQHMKFCRNLSFEALKDYLYEKLPKKHGNFQLDPYMNRPACGVFTKLPEWKAKKEIVYFGKCGTALNKNAACVVSYVSGALMAAWMANLPIEDVQAWEDPMGKVSQKAMFFRYNGNVAASQFK